MSIRAIIVVMLAVVCGLSAAVGMRQIYQTRAGQQEQAEAETMQIVVAKTAIPRAGILTADQAWSLVTLEPVADPLGGEYPYRGWEEVYQQGGNASPVPSSPRSDAAPHRSLLIHPSCACAMNKSE